MFQVLKYVPHHYFSPAKNAVVVPACPVHTENLVYLLLILLVLNVEIVVPTADQYAMRLGASESCWLGRSLKGPGLDVPMVGTGGPRLCI